MAPGFRGAAEGVGAATLKEILTADLVLCRLCFYTAGMNKPIPAPDHPFDPSRHSLRDNASTGLVALAGTPRALAAATILVPSRRAALALRAAFLEINGSGASLLPRIDPIGDVDEESPDILGMSADGGALPPAMDPVRRELWLARLLSGFRFGDSALAPAQSVQLAGSLARLLDSLCNADATPEQLVELLPDRFSRHWQDILKLLTILIDRWPAILAEEGVLDPAARRNRLIRMRCEAWRRDPPKDLVLVAGSTGTFAATRELIACVAGLPNGHVVLPGLDRGAAGHWQQIRGDAGHPQHQLSLLLETLDVLPENVAPWKAAGIDFEVGALRRDLMREAFKPAALSADWRRASQPTSAIRWQACRLSNAQPVPRRPNNCAAMETPRRTAALVTPDRQLAESVIAALQRWHIDIDDSAGRPLASCQAGGFLQCLVTMFAEDFAPVPLLAVLKHPLAAGGLSPSDFRARVNELERTVLRGYRLPGGLQGLCAAIAGNDRLLAFVENHVAAPLAPLVEAWAVTAPSLAALAQALGIAAEAMASRRQMDDGTVDQADGALHIWANEDGEAAASLLASLAEHGGAFEADTASFPHILGQMMATRTVRRTWQTHPRLAILGPVEARMQSADRLILGGFNEGAWPPRPEIDPWMNAEMRQAAGLPAHNWRTGLSAHDVWMAICAPEVIVTRALRNEDTVTTPSRWLQRLRAVLAALGIEAAVDDGQRFRDSLSTLSPVPAMMPCERPR